MAIDDRVCRDCSRPIRHEGNEWLDYTGADENFCGAGDTPTHMPGWEPTDFGYDLPGDQALYGQDNGRWGWIGKERNTVGSPTGTWFAHLHDTDLDDPGYSGTVVAEFIPHPSEAEAKRHVEAWVNGEPVISDSRSLDRQEN